MHGSPTLGTTWRRSSLRSPSNVCAAPYLFRALWKGGTTGLFGSTAVVLRAGRNYEAGEEIFVSYGPKGAAGYLEENGCAAVGFDLLLFLLLLNGAVGTTSFVCTCLMFYCCHEGSNGYAVQVPAVSGQGTRNVLFFS